ncbi:MAG: hypothetical protein FWG36_02165 [Oscillospiraceae bacterium]|nr:hypothetical protein [Oscillospiraceae bacterium]
MRICRVRLPCRTVGIKRDVNKRCAEGGAPYGREAAYRKPSEFSYIHLSQVGV